MSLELEEAERFRFYELSSGDRERIAGILREELMRRSEVLAAFLYGSILRCRLVRDVDVAVYTGGRADPLDYKFELDEALSRVVGVPVDLRVLDYAPPWFIVEVYESGVLLFTRAPGLPERLYLNALGQELGLKLYERLASER